MNCPNQEIFVIVYCVYTSYDRFVGLNIKSQRLFVTLSFVCTESLLELEEKSAVQSSARTLFTTVYYILFIETTRMPGTTKPLGQIRFALIASNVPSGIKVKFCLSSHRFHWSKMYEQ